MGRPAKSKPTRKDNLYEAKVTVGHSFDGKAIRKSFYSHISLADAKRKGEEYKVSAEVQAITGQTMQHTTAFREWATKWLISYKKPFLSDNGYRLTYEVNVNKHIIPYFEKSSLQSIKPIDIQNFYASKKYLSESVLQKISICLNGIFNTAIDNDLIYKNPAKNIKYLSDQEKNIKHIYTTEEIKVAKEFFKDKLPEAFLLLCTGLRRGEMLALKWSDINIPDKKLSVNSSVADCIGGGVVIRQPKFNSYRDIVIENDLIDLLNDFPHTSEYVFGTLQSPNTWSQKLKRYMIQFNAETGLKPLTAHELRHTYGTELRRRGVDIYTIQKIMGHKDIKMTTEIYVKNEFEQLKKSMEDS